MFEREKAIKNRKVKFWVKGVIFDLDGTLIDSGDVYFDIFEEVERELGMTVPPREILLETVRKANGNPWSLIPEGISKDRVKRLFKTTVELFSRTYKEKIALIDGVEKLIRQLNSAGLKLGLVTTTHSRFLDGKMHPLKKAGIADLLEAVLCIEDVNRLKPAPDPLIECAARLSVPISKCLYVGDSWVDIKAGKSAGMITVGVLTGMDSYERLEREGADVILESVADLSNIIVI